MSKQKIVKNDSLLDEGLCSIMGNRSAEGMTVSENLPRRRTFSSLAAEQQKMILQRRRFLKVNAAKWISFLSVLACFLFWATGKELIQPVVSVPGICICSAVSGYQLGCCLSNLQMMSVVKEEAL